MFQFDFEINPNRRSDGQVGKLAFVVGDPVETQPTASRTDGVRQPVADEDNKWLSDRLMACYND
jgi:hypothetical protein